MGSFILSRSISPPFKILLRRHSSKEKKKKKKAESGHGRIKSNQNRRRLFFNIFIGRVYAVIYFIYSSKPLVMTMEKAPSVLLHSSTYQLQSIRKEIY